jgi:hypothetical protein
MGYHVEVAGGEHIMEPIIEQILERYKALTPETRVNQYEPYFIYAGIKGKRDSLWLTCSQRGTVRLEYLDNGGEKDGELILSADRVLIELFGSLGIKGLFVYVAERIVPDLDNRFYKDYDVVRAKQSEIYQKLVAGETDVLGAICQLESAHYSF